MPKSTELSPLLGKLRFKAGMRVYVQSAPAGFAGELERLPNEIALAPRLTGRFDLILAFLTQQAELERMVPRFRKALGAEGLIWIAYPKGARLSTDLNRDIVRETVAPLGLETVAIVAIDQVWSALRCKIVEA